MPVVMPDPTAASISTGETVYVRECVGEPGDYALCTDPQNHDFQNPNWRFRGELASVPELDGFPRPIIDNRTLNGWLLIVRRDRNGSYSI